MRSKIFAAFAILAGATLCAGQNTIRIVIITSVTGSQAAFGEAHKNGYAIALDQINAKGGVLGKKI
jgi:branched-chain amino acid transport system substrate-binding protein